LKLLKKIIEFLFEKFVESDKDEPEDPSSLSDDIYARRLSGGDRRKLEIESITLKLINKYPTANLAFLKAIVTETIAEYRASAHRSH
jgi:hypothetical protein